MLKHPAIATALVLTCSLLTGCDAVTGALGIESPEKVAAARDADGRAIGGACRYSARALEDCYALNRKSDRASIFAGWREMNDYMRENKIEAVAPQATTQVAEGKVADPADSGKATPADKVGAGSERGKPPRGREGKSDDS